MRAPAHRRTLRKVMWGGCIASVLVVLWAWGGCSRTPASQPPPLSPRGTIAAVIRAREAGRYQEIRQLTVPEHAQDVFVTLGAVDSFLAANQELCELVRAHVGLGLAGTIDQSHRAYYLDIFSKYVELLNETVDGSTAIVSYVVDHQLPVRRTRLRLVEGTWRYDPGPGEYRQLAQAFERMARGLRQVSDGIRKGRLPAEELRHDPDKLVEEVRIRMLPGVKLLPPPPQQDRKP